LLIEERDENLRAVAQKAIGLEDREARMDQMIGGSLALTGRNEVQDNLRKGNPAKRWRQKRERPVQRHGRFVSFL
jgi:hypothetical protein